MYGAFHFPARMVVARLQDGSLWLHSPVPIGHRLAAELDALGPVRYLVAPNRLHHMYLGGAIERYPQAEVWGAPGLDRKRSDLRFDASLESDDHPWSDDLETIGLPGVPWIEETVFVHHASRTLIATDLLFNIHRVSNRLTRWTLSLVRAFGRPAQSMLWRIACRDRPALRSALDPLLTAPHGFDRLVIAHGDVIESDAPRILRDNLAWLLGTRPALVESTPAPTESAVRVSASSR